MKPTHVINVTPGFCPFPLLPEIARPEFIDFPSGCEPHIRLHPLMEMVLANGDLVHRTDINAIRRRLNDQRTRR